MINVDEAIRIAKIIEYCPEDRLPLVVEIFRQADVNIESLQAATECRVEDILEKVRNAFPETKSDDGAYIIPAAAFTDFCRQNNMNPNRTRADLARAGAIQTSKERGRMKYTVPVRTGSEITRCVVILPE